MNRQRTHADWALLLRGKFSNRPNVQLGAEIELASTFMKNLLDTLAFMFMFVTVFLLTRAIAIPNALTCRALLEGIALLTALRTHLF